MSWTVTQAVEKLQKIAEGFHSNHSTRKDIQEVIDMLSSPDIGYCEWSVEDVLMQAQNEGLRISTEDAKELLADMMRKHDASIGINWDTISTYLNSGAYGTEEIHGERG